MGTSPIGPATCRLADPERVRRLRRHRHRGTDLDTSEDLSPSFRVGYDPGKQLLQVAVEARDDVLYPAGIMDRTDACKIYVSALQKTDTQEVMIALSEKLDRIDAGERKGSA